jgi:DNA-binding NarL/FixJ family response regulator
MTDRYYDYVNAADRAHREEMARASSRLLEAINWARKGYNPGTSHDAIKLPPDWTGREIRSAEYKERAAPRPSNERVREMLKQGLSPGEIARELKVSHQRVVWMIKAIKTERKSDRQMEMIRSNLWG